MLPWKIFMILALIGHILCGISDGFLYDDLLYHVSGISWDAGIRSGVFDRGGDGKNTTSDVGGDFQFTASCGCDTADETSCKSECDRSDHVCRITVFDLGNIRGYFSGYVIKIKYVC